MGAAMYDTNPDLSRPWTLPPGMRVQIGKGRTHRTHHLCWYKGVFFCRRCGHYGQENRRILKLADPCYDQRRDHQNITRMKSLEGGRKPDSVQAWPRPANIPGDALKGILHPQGREEAGTTANVFSQPEEDTPYEWESYVYVDPKSAFEEDEEEPWYWEVLDAPPPEADYPGSPDPKDYDDQQEAAGALFSHSSDSPAPTWHPGVCDAPYSYYPATLRKAWRDSFMGPVHGIKPETGIYMGEDNESTGCAPPTPVTGHTPPHSPEDPGQSPAPGQDQASEEGMTLTQAHAWCYASDQEGTETAYTAIGATEPDTQDHAAPGEPPRSTGDAHTSELTLTQAHAWLDTEGHSKSEARRWAV